MRVTEKWGLAQSNSWQLVAVVAALALATVSLFYLRLNTDVAWFLFLAERVDAGELLYVDRIEINLPWIVHLSRLPTMLARWLGVSSVLMLRSLILIATFASVFVTAGRWTSASKQGPSPWMVAAWLWLLLLWLPGSDIGEREHLLILALVPYVALRSWGPEPRTRMGVLVGLAAGAAVALKPHFIPVWIAIEIDRRLACGRWLRPESVSAGAVLGLSLLFLPILHLEYFDVIRHYGDLYGGFRRTSEWRLLVTEVLTVLVVVVGTIASMQDRELARWIRGFLVATVAALLVGVGQAKGFTYHLYPAHVFAGIVLLLVAFRLPSVRPDRSKVHLALLLGTSMWLYAIWGGNLHRWSESADTTTFDATVELLRNESDIASVLVLSVRMPDIFPAVNVSQAVSASRYNSMWPLLSLYEGVGESGGDVPHRRPRDMGALEQRFLKDVVDDLLAYRPAILLVDEEVEPALGGRFDFIAYLAQDSAAARELEEYRPEGRFGRLRLYRRVD